MTRVVSWLAVLYVVLLSSARSGLPMNAQWGDLLLLPLAAAMVWNGRRGGLDRWWRAEDAPLALYLGITLITAVASVDPVSGMKHLAKQISVALVFLVFRGLAVDDGLTRRLQIAFVTSLTLVTAASLAFVFLPVQALVARGWLGMVSSLPLFGRVVRLRGMFETPELLGNALLLALVLGLTFYRLAEPRVRRVWIAIVVLFCAGEFLTFSHSVAGFAVAGALMVLRDVPSRAMRRVAWTCVGVLVLAVNAASILEPAGGPPSGYSVAPLTIEVGDARVVGRLNHYAALKQVAWTAFLEHPLIGIGPGRFMTETERAYRDGRLTARYRVKPAQCDLAGRLAETGLVGGASLLLLWASWIRATRQRTAPPHAFRFAARAAVIGILVNSLNADVMNFRFLWLALAWAAEPNHDHDHPRP